MTAASTPVNDGERQSVLDSYAEELAKRQIHDVLVRILAEREPELLDHVRSLAEMAREVGLRMGMSGAEVDELVRAADLHDIGKVAIPDSILHKPEPLTHEEWSLMRTHTLLGERILGAAPALWPIAEVVRATHERWDGEGYPDGRAGQDIPLAARIIFVCDALNAMTSRRSYRMTLDVEDALSELRRCAGTQFDPDVVEVLCTEVMPARAAAVAAVSPS